MTMLKAHDHIQSNHSPTAVVEAVTRATGILLLMGIAVVHLVQLVPTFRSTPFLGMAFVGLIAGSVVVGARLVNPDISGSRLWLPVLALGIASLAGYVFTRVMSTPLDNQDVGNWSCMLGIAALYIEGTLLALGAYAISVVPQHDSVEVAAANSGRVQQPERGLVGVGHGDESRR